MKKILNTILAITAISVIGILASCKAQEVYYGTPEANDFELGEQVVIKTVGTLYGYTSGVKYYVENTNPKTQEANPYIEYNDYIYYFERTAYDTFIPIIEDTKNGGYFEYDFECSERNFNVKYEDNGVYIRWDFPNDLNPDDDVEDDNVATTDNIKTEDGKNLYEKKWDSSAGKYVYKLATKPASYKDAKVKSVKIKITGTDAHNGSNQITKEVTVNFSKNATKTKTYTKQEW